MEERYALLRETKNGRPRKVPLTTRALAVVEALMADCGSDEEPLLKLTANALKIAFFRRIVPKAGLKDLHFHDLRHEAISRLAESGEFQLIELQAISGHRDTRMLLRYAHLCCGNLARKMDHVAGERTTREYFHRGRRRSAEKVTPILMAPRLEGKEEPSASRQLPKNVVSFSEYRKSWQEVG